MDQMVLLTQQWLNKTYGDKPGFGSVITDGNTGWDTINGLIRALQIELGITETANNFGKGTQSRFKKRWPNGIDQTDESNNIHGIIQGALWCKGYEAEYGGITEEFTYNVANSISDLKSDIGLSDISSTVDLELMMVLLSMKQFKLLSLYGGKEDIRVTQQAVNSKYKNYTGIIPTDGLYGREMNTALIQVLQAVEGFTPAEATGNFGNGTRSRLKTISEGTSEWVWLASVALTCNGYSLTPTSTWNNAIVSALYKFQAEHVIPVTGKVDPTTWMSLLTSKGDPNRSCVACDTRFEITDEFAECLKADGYRIVGRYLSEPDQKNTAEKDYFKALRTGELERIVSHGLQYFPIFQEYSTELRHFTAENGARHAKEAVASAKRLGVPPTVIYFAVDYDATNPEISSNILPYFKAVKENMHGGYRIGIYASRNICTRVSKAGYAVASFVSDMSTGFSGNLGFSIPSNWAFDQFHEIPGYKGKWDLDRVAYSGRFGAVGSVNHSTGNPQSKITYVAPPNPDTSRLTKIEKVIDLIQQLESVYDKWRKVYQKYAVALEYHPLSVTQGVINYLAKAYMTNLKFAIAGAFADPFFIIFMEKEYPALKDKLDTYIGNKRDEVADISGGKNDIAHFAYTLYCYAYSNLAPDHWTGWAGDLATGMDDLHKYLQKYPSLDRMKTAYALIGSDSSAQSEYFKANHVSNKLGIRCNFTDFCDDADAIYLGMNLRNASDENLHTLSDMMTTYYSSITAQKRYTAYAQDGLDFSSFKALENSIKAKMYGCLEKIIWFGLLAKLAGESTDEERDACCIAMAHYLLAKSK